PSVDPSLPTMKFTHSLLFLSLLGLFSASLAAKTVRKARAQGEAKVSSSNSTTVIQCGCGCGCGCCGCGCCKRKRRDHSAVVKGNKKTTTSRFARVKRDLGMEEPEQSKNEKEEECERSCEEEKEETKEQ
ncbi:hypothetical protein PMAYCL1PPCAC_03674, partial [Pristionchus mayeri]